MPSITSLLDSDMESNHQFIDENSLISSVNDESSIAQSKDAANKKTKKRKCVTMPKKSRAKPAVKNEDAPNARPAGTKRKAKDEAVEENELVDTEASKPRSRTTKATRTKKSAPAETAAKATTSKAAKKGKASEDIDVEEAVPSPVAVRSNFAPTKTVRTVPKPVAAARTKPLAKGAARVRVGATEEGMSEAELEEQDEIVELQPPRKRARTEGRVGQEPSYFRRAGSASDTERGDPMLRRKLGDMTRKYENIDMKFRNLKDVAVSEANANVEKVRKQCEAITEASNKLVTSLRKELALQAPLVEEARKSRKITQTQDAEVGKLRNANKDLSNTLSAAQNEIKALQTKLATAKAAPAPTEIKPQAIANKAIAMARPPISRLIIRGVKQAEDGDTYDCIQTGRNGTLHFKLFVDQENAKNASFEDTEFLYTPLLDANRDRDLIEMMPDYLAEDITFERQVAPKFYARVVKTLTERPSLEEED